MATQVVYAVPNLPVTPPPSVWQGVTSIWQGWDGSLWDLTSTTAGAILGPGVRGVGMPEFSSFESEADGRPGVRFRGARAQKREVFWPLHTYSDASSAEWFERDAAFWRTMHPENAGIWTITRPDGSYRTLTLRFVSDDLTSDLTPGRAGWQTYGITLQADFPYWQGEPIVRSWDNGATNDFIPGAGAPPFYISAASQFATATMPNPGDVPGWPTWTVTGPCTSVTVGVAGHLVTYTGTLTAGQTLLINSREMSARVGATIMTQNLVARDFWPIAEGAEVPVSIAMTGTGTITASLTPAFFRAW